VDGRPVAGARLVVEAFDLADRYPARAATDEYLRQSVRRQFEHVMAGAPDDQHQTGLTMRWMWIDRFTEFVRGERSVAIKNVSQTEDPLYEYLPGFPVFPCSLIVEGMAWTGGILANDQRHFQDRVVLAKVNKAVFHRPALPGDQLRYTAVIDRLQREGAFISGTSHVGDELQAEVELFLAHLGESFEEVEGDLADPAQLLGMLRLFGLYDVGRTPDGDPIDIPEKLLKAEREGLAAEREERS
jgi:3-hydroxyacyl-[acyl-carrier-protein] dehydratase